MTILDVASLLSSTFSTPDRPPLSTRSTIRFQDGFEGEWRRLIHQIHLNQGQIMMNNYERCAHLRSRERKVRIQLSTPYCFNPMDVFQVIPKHEFPIIWRFVVKFLTIMPTTVGCEQSFRSTCQKKPEWFFFSSVLNYTEMT